MTISMDDLSKKKRKRIERLCQIPADYEWREMKTLLEGFGMKEQSNGGSHVKFYDPNDPSRVINLVKPHKGNPPVMPRAYLRATVQRLTEVGLIT